MPQGVNEFQSEYKSYLELWENGFPSCLNKTSFKESPPALQEIINYNLYEGGKRLRPVLCLAAARHIQLDESVAMFLATAVECLHAYSLVHDDLPAMDDDDYRRGRLSCHKKFGEASAILAGDALQSLSYELLGAAMSPSSVIRYFARAAGPFGMVGGQFLDMTSGKKEPSFLADMHKRKTGYLFCAGLILPCLYKDPDADIHALETWGLELGLLFQILDDILDATSSAKELGKTAGKDIDQNKLTYVTLYGVEKAREIAAQKKDNLQNTAALLFRGSPLLENIADYFYSRKK